MVVRHWTRSPRCLLPANVGLELWAICSSVRYPFLWQEGGTRWSLVFLPTKTILSFYDFLKSRVVSVPSAYKAPLRRYQLMFELSFHVSSGDGDNRSTCSDFLCQRMPPCGSYSQLTYLNHFPAKIPGFLQMPEKTMQRNCFGWKL